MKRFLMTALMILSGVMASAATYRDTSVPLTTVPDLDLTRYMGRWYEIARFPISFEQDCINVTADYSLRADGRVTVTNTCTKSTTGKVKTANGLAEAVAPATLKVSFIPVLKLFWLLSPNYYVLYISEDYNLAVIGLPKGSSGWILARTPAISEQRLQTALSVLQKNGYDTSVLIRTQQDTRQEKE